MPSWFTVAIAVALPAQVATMVLVLEPRTRVRVVHTTSTDLIPMPVPIAVEHEVHVPVDRIACPPARTDARAVTPAAVPEAITHVRPSPSNAGWIAAWNDEHIYISTDAGASWQRRLDAAGAVQDVAFDCFGRALAMRGNLVGVRDGRAETWRPVAIGEEGAVLLGGGPDVVVIGHGSTGDAADVRLLVSGDLGATWQDRKLPTYWEGGGVRGRQHEDGTVLAMLPIVDCMSEVPFVFRWKDGRVEDFDTELRTDLAFFGARMVSSIGWQAIGGDSRHDLPDEVGAYPTVVEGAARPILIGSDGPWRLDGNRATRLPWQLGGEEESPVADPAGRIWSVLCGRPHVSTRTPPAACPPAPEAR